MAAVSASEREAVEAVSRRWWLWLLVFAGIWALMEGLLNIVRAFQVRSLGKLI